MERKIPLLGTSIIVNTTEKSYFQVEILGTKTKTASLYKKRFCKSVRFNTNKPQTHKNLKGRYERSHREKAKLTEIETLCLYFQNFL